MKHQAAGNYLKAHRKRSGLSQREIGKLLGYNDPGQVSRHEQSRSTPPLTIALSYEIIFKVSVSGIFVGMRGSIERGIESKLQQLEAELLNRSARDRDANLVAQKILWLKERRGQ
jgi:transcriptional regulator with XRE-family HTH domain